MDKLTLIKDWLAQLRCHLYDEPLRGFKNRE